MNLSTWDEYSLCTDKSFLRTSDLSGEQEPPSPYEQSTASETELSLSISTRLRRTACLPKPNSKPGGVVALRPFRGPIPTRRLCRARARLSAHVPPASARRRIRRPGYQQPGLTISKGQALAPVQLSLVGDDVQVSTL